MTYPPNGPDQQPSSGPFGASGQDPQDQPAPGQYPPGEYPQNEYPQNQYPQHQHPGQYPHDPYQGQYQQGQYQQGQYQQGQYPPGGYPPGQYPGFAGSAAPQGVSQAACTWHADRPTAVHCSRCGRPACPECLTQASVGQHCRACVAESRRTQRVATTVSGARHGVPPLVAMVLIGINVLAYIVTAADAGSFNEPQNGKLFFEFALIPGNVGAGHWWGVLTAGFLHFGVLHLATNMISLYFIGPPLEQVLGRVRFLVVYLLSLVGGSAAVMALGGASDFNAGASGAIFGILGALVVTYRRLKLNMTQLVSVLALNVVITFSISQISWQAHLGGLVVGAVVGAAMVYPKPAIRTMVQVVASAAVLVALAAVIFFRASSITPSPSCDFVDGGPQGSGVYCLSD